MSLRVIFVCAIGLILVDAMEKNTNFPDCPVRNEHLYTELGCKLGVHNMVCPFSYKCPYLETPPITGKCTYNSMIFDEGESIPDKKIEHDCSAGCFCSGGKITCASVECPELWFPPKEGCILQFKLNQCCSTKEICGEEVNQLETCEVEGKKYYEGQQIYPSNSCDICICTKKALRCKKINCGVELYNKDNLDAKCAPVFIESRKCCPIYFQCPETNDEINEPQMEDELKNHKMKCVYGDRQLSVGTTVQGSDKSVTCSCETPPLLTCIRKTRN